jgi:phosphatidylethanolamine/phosphatidyl-N-methylethanolamine N-methyltransferase
MNRAATGRRRQGRPPGDRVAILATFLRHPARTGTIAPSSPALARAMVRGLTVEPGETIVEFGPGTGPFTAEIQRLLPDPACYLGIEIESRLVSRLRERYPQLRVVEGSAEHAPQYLAEAGRARVRAVISGLPFASLPPAVQDGIIRSFAALAGPGAEVRTFQYVHSFALPTTMRFLRRMQAVFGPHTRHAVVLRNIPPAVILRWAREI